MKAAVLCSILVAARSANNICGSNATMGNAVLATLNLTYPGLEAVASAAAKGDLDGACEAVAAYYQTCSSGSWYRIGPVTPCTGGSCPMAGGQVDDIVLHDKFVIIGVRAVVPRNADGGLDWLYLGPNKDTDFLNVMNRHEYFSSLLGAWQKTGNPIYPQYYDALVKDWVLHNPCPDALSTQGATCYPVGDGTGPVCSWVGETSWTGKGSQRCISNAAQTPWRILETGIRMTGEWETAFFGFQNSSDFSTSARVLMVLAIAEHQAALVEDAGRPGKGTPNWEMTQWSGLLTSTLNFPELNNSSSFQTSALKELNDLLASGVYPDGVETEQASGYDIDTASAYFGTLQELERNGHALPPQAFLQHVEAMWNYGTYVSDPLGCLPHNGDSALCNSGYNTKVNDYFNRSDWVYLQTNGQNGTMPATAPIQGPSSMWPWAGQAVLRGGYSQGATWIFFDVGPYGSSVHGHRDKLNLLLHARKSLLLEDSGHFDYQGDTLSATLHKEYSHNASAHNTMTIDGCDQLPQPAVASAPVGNDTFSFTPAVDAVYGTMQMYDGLAGKASHSRAVYYQRSANWMDLTEGQQALDGDWLVVVDMLTSDRPRAVQITWHMHPNSKGIAFNTSTGEAVVGGVDYATGGTTDAQACIFPAQASAMNSAWDSVTLIKGQYRNATAGTNWQGWWSQSFADAVPAPVLSYEADKVPAKAVFAWLIVPLSQRVSCVGSITVLDVSDTGVIVSVSLGGQAAQTITVPLRV